MQLNPQTLQHELQSLTDKTNFCVALSGGLDSMVLLHLMHQCRPRYKVRAVHINHHLSPHSNEWASHCEAVSLAWGIPFNAYSVTIPEKTGESLEALAREFRYRMFSDVLSENECLVTAHTRDDQAETVLLQLLRGAGVSGLAAMPAKKKWANRFLLRPLLKSSRTDIEIYARHQHLSWVEDESNENIRFDRNYLRHHVMPLLKARWPNAAFSLARSSEHCAAAKQVLLEVSARDWVTVLSGYNNIDLSKLLNLPLLRQHQVIRYWIQQSGFVLPSTQQLEAIFNTVIHARHDAAPCVEWGGQQVRRYRKRLYLMKKTPVFQLRDAIPWDFSRALTLPENLGVLQIKKAQGQGMQLPATARPYSIRFRKGGETLIPAGRQKKHCLKKLFQEWGVPPWLRDRVPLLYDKNGCIAVIGYCIAEGFAVGPGEEGWDILFMANQLTPEFCAV